MTIGTDGDLYSLLGVQSFASEIEIRRAYRTLITKVHPDKGGSEDEFSAIQKAYQVLSDASKRKTYDETGKVEKSPGEEFMDSFAGGTFKDKTATADECGTNVAEQITLHQSADFQSHTAGFEAWMRMRGEGEVYTTDTIADKFGVVKSSYDGVPLPKLSIYEVKCNSPLSSVSKLSVSCCPLPAELEWGEVLVTIKYAPVNPADTYTIKLGGVYGDQQTAPPFICGHDCVGIVTKVGPGVKSLSENDWVIPAQPLMGTWRTMAVWKEKNLISVQKEAMPLECMATLREMCLAYRLLEDHGKLKPGDCVILNAANSTVGQLILQLCQLLRLRAIGVVRRREQVKHQKLVTWLKSLGATEVIAEDEQIRVALDDLKFFTKPKLALDSVGGESAIKLADCLSEGGELVVYGSMSGKSPVWPWQSWVFKNLKVSGFNLRKWIVSNRSKLPKMTEQLSKLVKAGKIRANYTEYELASELNEALDHALADGKDTKVLLQMSNLGVETAE